MSDNVIILGAGASADAGIPLMGQFVDTMWNIARRGRRAGNVPQKTLEILEAALEVREELDGFHGRAAFDAWNIEDILSILSFSNQKSLEKMTKAIASVIEHTCRVVHDGNLRNHSEKPDMYMSFWRALIAWSQKSNSPIPPVLTFNYDLVLERSLLRALVGKHYRHSVAFGYQGIEVDYSMRDKVRLKCSDAFWRNEDFSEVKGMILEEFLPETNFDELKLLTFEILKLHGSVNFSRPHRGRPPRRSGEFLLKALDDPLILPPVFNKATDSIGKKVWERAIQVLRKCKHLIICGYSLPQTDTFMQYFLKAALGPNQELNRIVVFDPVLFIGVNESDGAALRKRYAQNFSMPIQKRIEFSPNCNKGFGKPGGMSHLTATLATHPDSLLFG